MALRNAINKGRDVVQQLKDYRESIDHPGKKAAINEAIDKLENLLNTLPDSDNETKKKNTDEILNFLDDILNDIVKLSNDEGIIKAGARAANLLAKMKDPNANGMDLSKLLNCAFDLSNQMKGLSGSTSSLARDIANRGGLSEAAESAMKLDELIRKLDTGEFEFEPLVIPTIQPVQTSSTTSSTNITSTTTSTFTPPRAIVANPKTFEDTVDKVAYEIHQKAEKVQGFDESISVAESLFNLSGFARSGNRQEMLLASKSIDAQVKAFCIKLDKLEKSIQGTSAQSKREKERLHRCAQALKNYGMQLKILTSVKAASIDNNKDNDESLSSLTSSMGALFSEALSAVEIVTKTGLSK